MLSAISQPESAVGKQRVRTILDKVAGHLVVLLAHELQVQSSAVAHLVVHIVQASREEHLDASLDIGVLLAHTKLGQGSNGGGSNNCVLENHTIVDVADVLSRLSSFGTLQPDKMEDAYGQLGELAVLDELAEVGECLLLGVGDELDQVKHALHDCALELVTAFVA